MRLINADAIVFRCSYSGDCMASEEQCKKCSDYVCDFETIQNMLEIEVNESKPNLYLIERKIIC